MEENCIFVVWNYKYNRFLPCKILSKLDDKFVKVVEYHDKDGEITTTVPWSAIANKPD